MSIPRWPIEVSELKSVNSHRSEEPASAKREVRRLHKSLPKNIDELCKTVGVAVNRFTENLCGFLQILETERPTLRSGATLV
jgi:hypothetical protein